MLGGRGGKLAFGGCLQDMVFLCRLAHCVCAFSPSVLAPGSHRAPLNPGVTVAKGLGNAGHKHPIVVEGNDGCADAAQMVLHDSRVRLDHEHNNCARSCL